jgi:hypothetical protein
MLTDWASSRQRIGRYRCRCFLPTADGKMRETNNDANQKQQNIYFHVLSAVASGSGTPPSKQEAFQ